MTTLLVVSVTLAVAYGLFFSFSIFFIPLVEEFRWSRALTAGAFSVSTMVQGLTAPVAGVLVDRVGPRRVILGGVVFLGAASILASTIAAPWQLYLYTGVVGALGVVGLGWVPMGVLLARTFSERRGRVVGVAFSGMGIGVFVMGPLAQWLIAAFGWRAASALLGAGALVVLLPLVWFGTRETPAGRRGMRARMESGGGGSRASVDSRDVGGDRELSERRGVCARMGSGGGGSRASVVSSGGSLPLPAPSDPDPTLSEALGTRAFWALFCAYFLTPLAVFPVFTHQVAFAIDLGFPRLGVATIFGLVGLASSVGRAGFGVAADRFGGPLSATLSFGCTAGGALALLAVEAWPRTAWLVVFALLFGLGFGARGPIITAMATDLFGGRRFGVIYGVLNLANGIGAAIGPWFGGFVHDVSGSYRLAFLSSVLFSGLAAGCFWLARRRAP
ncbi:MAG: MFS transporter [Candidatus Rokubacteria bacterium]|nr:MFS transporter [Candidatus Rokubacteria bacterium]